MKRLTILILLVCTIGFTPIVGYTTTTQKRATHTKKIKKHRIRFPGSKAWQIRENKRADKEGLSRIKNRKVMKRMIAKDYLVPIKESKTIKFRNVPSARRFGRPWLRRMIQDSAKKYSKKFRKSVVWIGSLTRDEVTQENLSNGNAAKATGPTASMHERGNTWDWSKFGMSSQQSDWVRLYLKPLVDSGQIAVIEEHVQPCFHITVHKSYGQRHTVKKSLNKKQTQKSKKRKK